jgi:pimeloyl-ACP methyl ester carboxylesterase
MRGKRGMAVITRYAKSGDLHIAYQVMGRGPLDLVVVPGFVSHLEVQQESPRCGHLYERLSSFSRLIRFDKRGTGLPDRVLAIPTLEERMDDVQAVQGFAGTVSTTSSRAKCM